MICGVPEAVRGGTRYFSFGGRLVNDSVHDHASDDVQLATLPVHHVDGVARADSPLSEYVAGGVIE